MSDHSISPPELTDLAREKAADLGFDWFGAAKADLLEDELNDLRQWLDEGRHGEMAWLANDPERRADPRRVVEDCRSVVVLGLNYLREKVAPEDVQPPAPGFGRISKYALTRDYHRVMEKRLRRLARVIDDAVPGATSRSYVDYGPALERVWAARAGIGFQGKHTLLIHPGQGSFHFLGVVLTTAQLQPTVEPARQGAAGCGDCRRCLDACPTGAITAPWEFDARRCLSYLTIEKDGPVAEEFWPHFAGYLFGCDICQDVCPYNLSRAEPTEESPLGARIVPRHVALGDLLGAPEKFLETLRETSSPLKRAGVESLMRNAAIVSSENGTQHELPQLNELAQNPQFPDWLRDTFRRAADRLSQQLTKHGKNQAKTGQNVKKESTRGGDL